MSDLYTESNLLNKFNEHWKDENKLEIDEKENKLYKNPFKICILQNFIDNDEKIIEKIAEEMSTCEWTRKQMDLYEFSQVMIDRDDFQLPYLKSFYQFLYSTVMPWMETVTGFELTSMSASCSMYNSGDYLLVHDDLLSNRKIAFVFYLSPWCNDWTESMGGALELFEADQNNLPKFPVVKKLYPKNNQFIFFQVCDKSFHQVGEVTSLNFPRLSINGWFHTAIPTELSHKQHIPDKVFQYAPPHTDDILTGEWINECYLNSKIKSQIQRHIEDSSEISLEEFLIPEFFEAVEVELKTNPDLKWTIEGPANEKYFEVLSLANIKGPINDLVHLLKSQEFFKLLFEFTELDFYGAEAKNPECEISFQRWGAGCYTILRDTNEFCENSLDTIMYFNSIDNVGITTYLTPEGDDNAEILSNDSRNSENLENIDTEENVLLTLYPRNNVLNLIYRTAGTARFTKYVSKSVIKSNDFVYVLVCNYKE